MRDTHQAKLDTLIKLDWFHNIRQTQTNSKLLIIFCNLQYAIQILFQPFRLFWIFFNSLEMVWISLKISSKFSEHCWFGQ